MAFQLAGVIPSPEWIGEPPCRCGNDIDLGGTGNVWGANAGLEISPSTGGLAFPKPNNRVLCTQAPADGEATAINTSWQEIALLRIRAGQYHIMVNPYGQQLAADDTMIGWEPDSQATYQITDVLNPIRHPGAAALRGLWGNSTVFSATRLQPAKVLGRVKLVRIQTRAFAPYGIFRYLGACYVIEEVSGRLRFVTPAQMSAEFGVLKLDNGEIEEF